MELLHEFCEGYIDTLGSENYGRCEKCGEEGLFRVVREKDGNAFAIFYEATGGAELLFLCAVATSLLLPLAIRIITRRPKTMRLLEIVVSFLICLIGSQRICPSRKVVLSHYLFLLTLIAQPHIFSHTHWCASPAGLSPTHRHDLD